MTLTHLLYDCRVADPARLRSAAPWEHVLVEAAEAAGATVLAARFHQFAPVGVTGILLLAESHVSVHTWPEHRRAALDVFTCGPMDATAIVDTVRAWLDPVEETLRTVDRSNVDLSVLRP
ncbi:MAG: adenosylmethionine decarboxylase [Bacteroidota bacterium]